MELYFSVHETGVYNTGGLDLDDLWDEMDGTDADAFFEVLVCKVALFAIEQNVRFGAVVGFTFDHDGDEMEIYQAQDDATWIREVAQLVEFIKSNQRGAPDGAIFARVNDLGWHYVDFSSDLKTMGDGYYGEFSGDYEEHAREYMENCGEELLDQHEYYFDYRAYGENLVDEFDRCAWADQEYLFTR